MRRKSAQLGSRAGPQPPRVWLSPHRALGHPLPQKSQRGPPGGSEPPAPSLGMPSWFLACFAAGTPRNCKRNHRAGAAGTPRCPPVSPWLILGARSSPASQFWMWISDRDTPCATRAFRVTQLFPGLPATLWLLRQLLIPTQGWLKIKIHPGRAAAWILPRNTWGMLRDEAGSSPSTLRARPLPHHGSTQG